MATDGPEREVEWAGLGDPAHGEQERADKSRIPSGTMLSVRENGGGQRRVAGREDSRVVDQPLEELWDGRR
ncbi:hypothetical protein Lfu02_30540 [Longispora fulva]|nr:hypothetical protein Lfu02_30540 [Longispora fulva]